MDEWRLKDFRVLIEYMPDEPSFEDQLTKLNFVQNLADEAFKLGGFVNKIAAVTIYSSLLDFYLVQTAKLIEGVALKSQLATGRTPTFNPSNDKYFYDNSVRSQQIIKEVRRHLNFGAGTGTKEEAEEINKLGLCAMKRAGKFIDRRNIVVHHIGNPSQRIKDIEIACGCAVSHYRKFLEDQKKFFEAIGPYRFGDKELKYFADKYTSSKDS